MGDYKLNTEEIENIINSIGAMAEILATFYKTLIENEFDDEQSIYLTCEYMKAVFGK